MKEIALKESIEQKILLIRGQRVMLDCDLAELYGIETFNLNKAVKRNIERFPDDFMFQITEVEFKTLRFQFGMSKSGRGGRRYFPHVFSENGVAMLSSVLKSKRAIHVNIQIMRTFIQLREFLLTHRDLKRKIEDMENKYDSQFRVVFDAILQLLDPPVKKQKRRIGFK